MKRVFDKKTCLRLNGLTFRLKSNGMKCILIIHNLRDKAITDLSVADNNDVRLALSVVGTFATKGTSRLTDYCLAYSYLPQYCESNIRVLLLFCRKVKIINRGNANSLALLMKFVDQEFTESIGD